ncbi:MAG TPA: sigma factor-like helix-turn-helix DNA-binding protein, partial [Candidatus Saccharimonadales bacterium]
MSEQTTAGKLQTEQLIADVLGTIDREREREIVARRFGLFDRKETLEQIGELLGITRERVRQLEKSVVTRLKTTAEQQSLPQVDQFQTDVVAYLETVGGVARVSNLTAELVDDANRIEQARVSFLSQLCPQLLVLTEDDHFYNSVALKDSRDEKQLKAAVATVIDAVKKLGEPKEIGAVAAEAGMNDAKEVEALASTSKQLATLNGRWGLIKWPMVNP